MNNLKKVFIDGSQGTTGLKIKDRLQNRSDIELIEISEEDRKNPVIIKECINKSDVTLLCLPDLASIEAVSMVTNPNTVIIDTSTAFRCDPSFTYGFPEIFNNKEKIKTSKRIANPGCHASGFISLIAPLREKGLLKSDVYLTCFSLTGYSGGGKKMIAQYEDSSRSNLLDGPRQYGLNQTHKHLKEMAYICKLDNLPIFVPVVDDYYCGMEVIVPLFKKDINMTVEELKSFYADYYKDTLISVVDDSDDPNFLSAVKLSKKDNMQITVTGNDDRIVLTSRFDNLGKGASGSAIENLNLVIGADIKKSLVEE